MKNLRHFLSLMFFLLVPFTIMAQEDITDQYLQNADLSSFGEGWDYDFYTDWNTGADVPVVEFYHTWGANPGADIGYARDFHFTQTITLPAGDYRIAVSAFYREGNGNGTNTKAYIFAGDKQQYVYGLTAQEQADVSGRTGKYVGASDLLRAANAFSQGDFSNAFDFSLTTEQEITLGFRGYIDTYCSWCILGPVKLYKYSLENYLEDYRAKVAEANALTGKMGAAEAQALSDAIVPESSFNLSAEVTEAIATLTNAINDARKSIADYADLTAALENAATIRSNVEGQADANILATYDNAIADFLNAYNAGTVNDFAGSIAFVEEAVIPLVKSQKADNSDFTMAIINPHVNGSDGWTCDRPYGGNGPMLNNDKFEYWAGNAYSREDGSFDYYQIISGLPNGYYRVSASMYNSLNDEGGDYTEFAPSSGLYAASGANEVITLVEEDGTTLKSYTTDEILVTDGTIRIGVKNAVTPMAARWFVADDFHLTLVRSEKENDVIQFADAKVKAICVENWDTNGDGELSYGEAAAVTDLGEVFKENREITSFDELQYFTGIREIQFECFHNCAELTSIHIPQNVTFIDQVSFAGCGKLTDVQFGENENIALVSGIIQHCNSLISITLPKGAHLYGNPFLNHCTNLVEILVDERNEELTSVDGILFSKDLKTLMVYPNAKGSHYTIPDGVTSINDDAFYGCPNLASVTIPASITSIGSNAFASTNLTSIQLPEGLNVIQAYLFAWCYNLKEVNIPDSVTRIERYSIARTAITTLTIPTNVTFIGNNAFWGNEQLEIVISQIKTPFAIPEDAFYLQDNATFTSATLYVPVGTKALYEATEGWNKFQNIVEMEGEEPSTDIAIDATNFPDENFRNWILAQDYGQDGVLTQEEIEGITNINVGGKGIADLTGIELFTNVTYLWCNNNQLTSLDVSKDVALIYLSCYKNQLTSLDVSKNTTLQALECSSNQLTYLDVSKNTALQSLNCSVNQLTSLDVTNNVALQWLYCYNDQLTSLDVSKNTTLQVLQCSSNQLTYLDVSKNTALQNLSCSENQLTSLDVTNNVAVQGLYCDNNQLTSLDVTNNVELQQLYCYNNQLTSLDVTNNVAVQQLYCFNNQLTSLDVTNNVELQQLYCYNNQLTSLDVSNNVALTVLDCNLNQLMSLDLTKNVELTGLYCGHNQLTSLDLSKNTALQSLGCNSNQLTSLDLTNNDDLTTLYCYGNQIKETGMDGLVSSLPTVDFRNLYAMDSPEWGEGNEITPAQVAAANSRGWKVFQYDAEAGDWEEIVGEEIEYSWVKMATGTCYNNFFYDESNPFSGLELYVREDNPECFKIKDWLFGNDFEFIWNRTTNKCVVRKQLIGYEHPSYGPMSIIEGSNFGSYSEHSYYDPETSTFHFFPVYFVDAGSWGQYEDRFEITAFDTDVIMGDANGDGEVNVSDIVEIVNYILQKPSQRFVLAASDLNGDSEVNVTDIVKVVSIILSADASHVRSLYPIDIAEEEGEDQLNLIDSSHQTYALSLDNSHEFVAAQFDVHLDGNRCINDIVLNSARCNGHLTAYTEIAPNVYRVIVYSTDNSTFSGDSGEFINLMMNKPGNILIDNIIFVTSQMNEVRFAPLSSNATQIADIDGRQADTIYSVSGYKVEHQAQTLRKGIYIINGKKHIVK